MRSDKSILVLDLDGRVKESVHQLECLLLVIEESPAINSLQVQIEVSLRLAAFNHLLQLSWLLGEQCREVDGLHVIDWEWSSIPVDGLLLG